MVLLCASCYLQVFNSLAGRFARREVERALEALVYEAIAYNTIDDVHFKVPRPMAP